MQAHRGVRGLSIDTTSLKIGSVVSRKTIFFRKVKKICKTSKKSPVPIFFLYNTLFYQTGTFYQTRICHEIKNFAKIKGLKIEC